MNTQLRDKKIFVTGGTGFLGSRLVPLLVQAGAKVSVLCRSSSKTSHLPQGVDFVQGDLCCSLIQNTPALRAIAEADIVIHMAALLFGLDWQDYLVANTQAAQHLVEALHACEQAGTGPQKVIHVSSLAGAGPCDQDQGRSENALPEPVSAYGWSKFISETILSKALGDRLVIIRPPIIYGSGDKGLLPVYKGIQKGLAVTPGLGRSFPVSICHVDDVALAITLLCQESSKGIYHVSDGNVYPMADFYRAIAQEMGCKLKIIALPLWLMGLTAALSTLACQLYSKVRAKPFIPNWNSDKFNESKQVGWVAMPTRLAAEFGFTPTRTLASGVQETISGNKKLGLL